MFVDLCKQVVQLSWPQIDTQSIQEVVVGEAAGDAQYQDDTIIYWNNDEILEDTLPYQDDSDDDFGNRMSYLYNNTPMRIPVRIDPPHPFVCRRRRLNGAVLRMRPEKPRSRVLVGVAR
jgi:hypothetical protein